MMSLGYPNRQMVRPGSGPRSVCRYECVYTRKSPWERARPMSQKCLKQERWLSIPLGRRQSLAGEVWQNTLGSFTEKRHPGSSPAWLLSVRRMQQQGEGVRPSLSLLERALLGWGAAAPPALLLFPLPREPVFRLARLLPLRFSQGSPPRTPLSSPLWVFCRPPLLHLSSVTRWPLPEVASVPVTSHRLGWHAASSPGPKNLGTLLWVDPTFWRMDSHPAILATLPRICMWLSCVTAEHELLWAG